MAEVTLEFLGEEIRRVLDEQRAMREELGAVRQDGANLR
jgi:hypothetical protein